jgi:hypothetical protein
VNLLYVNNRAHGAALRHLTRFHDHFPNQTQVTEGNVRRKRKARMSVINITSYYPNWKAKGAQGIEGGNGARKEEVGRLNGKSAGTW